MKSNNLVAVLLAASLSVGYAQTTAAHETALNDFYTGAGGASWTGVTGWGGSDPCGNLWTGVVCSGANVESVSLNEVGFDGPLPATWSDITTLATLELGLGLLSGGLDELDDMNSLRTLSLSNVGLGSIPTSWSSGTMVASVTTVNLDGNSFSGAIPNAFIASLSAIQTLSLSENGFSGSIPPAFASLPASATTLDLSENFLSGTLPVFPATLTTIDLSQNALEGPIPTLPHASGTLNLDLNTNAFQDFGSWAPTHNFASWAASSNSWTCPLPAFTVTPTDSASVNCFCPAGSASTATNAACADCPAGTASNSRRPAGSACSACAAGTYSDTDGESVCTNCAENTYSTEVGATSDSVCTACPNGETSLPGTGSENGCSGRLPEPEGDGVLLPILVGVAAVAAIGGGGYYIYARQANDGPKSSML